MKKIFQLHLILLTILGFLAAPVMAEDPSILVNVNKNNYSNYCSAPITSYLTKEGDGYMRVEKKTGKDSNKVVITYFDGNFQPVSESSLDLELPIYGGFYSDGNNYYIVCGQNNTSQDDNREVIRVIKYDKNWNRTGDVAVRGANTFVPFDGGTVRMTHSGNDLYVRTCHTMYASSDGLHHQSNMTVRINKSTMQLSTELSSTPGYVSHSFNQFIISDGDKIVTLDHGDAYPRAARITTYNVGGLENEHSKDIMEYAGETGQNATNASLGGLEASADHYLTVGNSSDQSSTSSTVRNIYVTATPKSDMDSVANNTQIRWLTGYTDNNTYPQTPQLVKFDDDNFLVLWGTLQNGQPTEDIHYVFVDGRGNPKGEVINAQGKVSDCQPISSNGSAFWYTNDGNDLKFYQVDGAGNLQTFIAASAPQKIYRLYNTVNGEHLYTPSQEEVKNLVQNPLWKNEGTGWYAPRNSGTPVYRLYNGGLGNHLYTTDPNEVGILTSQHGWTTDFNGQPIFMSGGDIPIYRVYNEGLGGLHHLTTDENEYNTLPAYGWAQEGVALYGQTCEGSNEVVFGDHVTEVTVHVGETITLPLTIYPQTDYSAHGAQWSGYYDFDYDNDEVRITGNSVGTGTANLDVRIANLYELTGTLVVHVVP